MAQLFEVPLSGMPQRFGISFVDTPYTFTFVYRNASMGGWVLDIGDGQNNPLVCGIPLVTGADLLAPYAYLNFNGIMLVQSDGDPAAVPTFDNLGTDSHVYWITLP
jgi:hypothetical protein